MIAQWAHTGGKITKRFKYKKNAVNISRCLIVNMIKSLTKSTNQCPEKQLEIRVNKCGGERLKAHSSYTWKASLKEGIAWLQALLSSYRSAKSPHSLVAILLLSLKLPSIPRLPSFSYADRQAIKTLPPPLTTSKSSHARVTFSLHLQPTTVIP